MSAKKNALGGDRLTFAGPLTRVELAREFPSPHMVLGSDHGKSVILRYDAQRGVLQVTCPGCGGIVCEVLVAGGEVPS